MVKAVPYGLLEIGALLSFAFLFVFDKAWRNSIGKLFVLIGNTGFGGIAGHGSVKPLHFLVTANNAVEAWIKSGLVASERVMAYALTRAAEPFVLMVGVLLALGLAFAELAKFAVHKASQAVTRVEHTTVIKKIGTATKVITEVTKTQFSHLTARVATLEHRIAHFAHAIPATVATPFPRIKRIEHDLTNVKARLKKAERVLAAGASAALVLTALKRLGLGWLRCNNVGKAGKAVCGMNPSLLESLLLDAALLTVSFNLEEFAKEMQTVTEEAASLIHRWAT